MQKEQLPPLGGFRDLIGGPKYEISARLREIFESFGFLATEMPALERQELLLGKLGDEAQKQLYLFEDNGGRKVGLRYDLTMSLGRYVAANLGGLNLPFKRYEIGPVWRAEKSQAGRYRQFTTADVDIVGVESISAEKELLEVIAAATEVVAEIKVMLNDRRLVNAALSQFKIDPDKTVKVMQMLDKRLKVTPAVLEEGLLKIGLTPSQARQTLEAFDENSTLEDFERLLGQEVCADLKELVRYGQSLGLEISFVPSMVRGLEYYTGPVIEGELLDVEESRLSVLGGGRYDSLVEGLTGQKVPAVGISFGVDRLADATSEFIREPEIFVVALPENVEEVREWARERREQGMIVEVYPDAEVEMGKQIKYADKKGYPAVYLPLEQEWREGKIVCRDLKTGRQESLARRELEGDE
jgi:histidyl-tRNA synthetase